MLTSNRFSTRLYLLATLLALPFMLGACAPNFAAERMYIQPSVKIPPREAPVAVLNNLRVTGSDQQKFMDVPQGHDSIQESVINAIGNSGRFSKVMNQAQASASPPGGNSSYFDIRITGGFKQEFRPWFWYLGMATGLGPTWPVMPRNGEISLVLEGSQEQDGVQLARFRFEEREEFRMFWYGPYRFWELQDQLDRMYLKLLDRLTQQLRTDVMVSSMGSDDQGASSSGVKVSPPRRLAYAMLDLRGEGLLESEAKTLTAKLRAELLNSGNFDLMERSRLEDVLAEQGFQQAACSNDECMVQMGRLVGVDRVLTGSVGRVGETWLLSVREVDVETGRILREVTQEVKGSIDNLLVEGIPALSRKLTNPAF